MTIKLQQKSGVIVQAEEPTCLGSEEYYDLLPTDLFLTERILATIVVPGSIDAHRLKVATAHALSRYPLFAGRLVKQVVGKDTPKWRIRLSNDGAYFRVVDSDALKIVPMDAVGQMVPWMVDNRDEALEDSSANRALLRITLTRFTKIGETALTFSCAHAAADGWASYKFIHTVSEKYQDINVPTTTFTHERPPQPTITPNSGAQLWTLSPGRVGPYAVGVFPSDTPPRSDEAPVRRFDFRFTASQLAQLRNAVQEMPPHNSEEILRLSAQDALVAVVTASHNLADTSGPKIQCIYTIFNHRGVDPWPKNVTGNAIVNPLVELEPETEDSPMTNLYSVASAVRRSLIRCRDPEHIAAHVAAYGNIMKATADRGGYIGYMSYPGILVVNSMRRLDWTSAHFGFPGQARFYQTMPHMSPRYLKLFSPNPTILADGTTISNEGGVEGMFYIRPALHGPFARALQQVTKELGMDGEVEFVIQPKDITIV